MHFSTIPRTKGDKESRYVSIEKVIIFGKNDDSCRSVVYLNGLSLC